MALDYRRPHRCRSRRDSVARCRRTGFPRIILASIRRHRPSCKRPATRPCRTRSPRHGITDRLALARCSYYVRLALFDIVNLGVAGRGTPAERHPRSCGCLRAGACYLPVISGGEHQILWPAPRRPRCGGAERARQNFAGSNVECRLSGGGIANDGNALAAVPRWHDNC
jgi:hypothetical protein